MWQSNQDHIRRLQCGALAMFVICYINSNMMIQLQLHWLLICVGLAQACPNKSPCWLAVLSYISHWVIPNPSYHTDIVISRFLCACDYIVWAQDYLYSMAYIDLLDDQFSCVLVHKLNLSTANKVNANITYAGALNYMHTS